MTDSAIASRSSFVGIIWRSMIVVALLGFGFWLGRRNTDSAKPTSAASITPPHPIPLTPKKNTHAMSHSITSLSDAHAEAKAIPLAFRKKLTPLYRAYLKVQVALTRDDAPSANQAAAVFFKELNTLGYTELSPPQVQLWRLTTAPLREAAGSLVSRVDLNEQRVLFAKISLGLEATVRAFGVVPDVTIRRFECSLAFSGKGASWLQAEAATANPFFGVTRLKCGEQTELISRP